MRWIGYVRVSTDEQAVSGLGLAAQREAIEAAAARAGAELVAVYEDPAQSAKNLNRPGLHAAFDALGRGDGDVLVVAKLDRLSRSLRDVLAVMEWLEHDGRLGLVPLDMPALDTTAPYGRAMLHMAAVFAELERQLISARTRDALAVKRARGEAIGPSASPDAVRREVERLDSEGLSLRAIAKRLEDDGWPTARGGRWQATTVQSILGRRPPAKPRDPKKDLPAAPKRPRRSPGRPRPTREAGAA